MLLCLSVVGGRERCYRLQTWLTAVLKVHPQQQLIVFFWILQFYTYKSIGYINPNPTCITFHDSKRPRATKNRRMNHWLEKQQLKTKFIMHMSSSTQEVCPWRLRPHVAVQGAAPECKYAEKKQCLSFISSPCHTNKHTCTDNSPTHARHPCALTRTHSDSDSP